MILFVVALSCEAQPVVEALKLTIHRRKPYKLFRDAAGRVELLVTGIGGACATKAIQWYCQDDVIHGAPQKIINYGIAGSGTLHYGKTYRISSVVLKDESHRINLLGDNERCPDDLLSHTFEQEFVGRDSEWPQNALVPKPFMSTCDLLSVASFEAIYPEGRTCVDMEGAYVVKTVQDLLPESLLVLLKVVSDTPSHPVGSINKTLVQGLISQSLPAILTEVDIPPYNPED